MKMKLTRRALKPELRRQGWSNNLKSELPFRKARWLTLGLARGNLYPEVCLIPVWSKVKCHKLGPMQGLRKPSQVWVRRLCNPS